MLPTEEARLRRWPRHNCAPSGCAPTHAICWPPRNPHRPRPTKQRPSSPRFPPCEAFERQPPAARPTVVQGAGVRNPSAFETFERCLEFDVMDVKESVVEHRGCVRRTCSEKSADIVHTARAAHRPGLMSPLQERNQPSSANAPSIFASMGVGPNCDVMRLASRKCWTASVGFFFVLKSRPRIISDRPKKWPFGSNCGF